MALGRQRDRQAEMLVTWSELPRSPGHVFYDRLQQVLISAAFDGFVEDQERSMLRSRVLAGLDRVRQQGKRLGRPKVAPKVGVENEVPSRSWIRVPDCG
jgi:hypothetical protein